VFVWVVFVRNMLKDHTHGAGFKVVHVTLAAISLAFAAGCLWIVSRARRGRPDVAGPASGDVMAPTGGSVVGVDGPD